MAQNEYTPLLRNRPDSAQYGERIYNRGRWRAEDEASSSSPAPSQPQVNSWNETHESVVVSSDTFSATRSARHQNYESADDKDIVLEEDHDALRADFESLDYEVSDNLLYQKEEKDKSSKRWKLYWRGIRRWFICFLIGVITGITAGIIDLGVEKMSSVKFSSVKELVDRCVVDYCMYSPHLIWLLFNIGLVMVGAVLTAYIEPVAAGSGIPQIKCYLNGVVVPHVVRIKTLVTKVVGVICAVAGGLAVGKEGPMIHSGAVIAAGVSQGRSTSLNFDFNMFHDFRSDTEKRDFVSAGAAAGVSAAFGAPVGGVLFSLEEGASFWNQALVWRIFFSSMVSTMTLNIVQSYIKGHPWELSYAGLINFGTFDSVQYKFYELFIVIAMGAIGGLTGAAFNHINYKLTIFRMKYVQRRWLQVIEVMIVAAYTGCFAYVLIFFSNDCKPLRENRESMLVQFFCNDGEYSSSARLFFDTPEATVKNLFHSPPGTYQVLTLTIFATGYFFLACWTYGLSVPSGLFIPCLLIGAAWGRIVGVLLGMTGHGATFGLSFYSLVGASSQLGGIVRMTISLTVILMEATANVPLGLPVMISLIVAKWVGDQFNEGIYDLHIHLQGVPLLGWEPLPMSANLSAKSVMSHPVTVLRMHESVGRIARILKEESHNGFPVVDEYDPHTPKIVDGCETFGTFRGLVLRSQLLMMLKKKLFQENPDINEIIGSLKMAHFNDCYPRYTPIQRISLTSEERNYHMNLEPFINQSHYVVLESASYTSIFKKFRSLGLRHMVVINFRNEVIGIVTRKDLARYTTAVNDGIVTIEERTIVH
ncbi:H(+)/Cl(-) exchange transporter 7 [Aplysia californica]|uniref:Chloride channel protein n=1 Tax=Aplysia californica TaxID=6500 RepID=A0ABM0JLN4_APLCA|nr:H(+)/Cl(-) exchange transporter 7 [Aplysia californica]